MVFARNRRTAEFEAAALPHLYDLHRTAARFLCDATRADDVVQDVYLQAWKSFDKFEPGTNCRAWLFRILFHTLQHYRRKWLNLRMVKENEEVIGHAAAPAPPVPEHLTDAQVLAALEAIPGDFRAVVLLVDVEEFSYKDAAHILNVPMGTVMSRLSRGRRLLREQLAGLARAHGIGGTLAGGGTA